MSELIAPELVLLDENLGDSRFDVIERLAHTIGQNIDLFNI